LVVKPILTQLNPGGSSLRLSPQKWRYLWLLSLTGAGATNVRECILPAIPHRGSVLKITRHTTTRAAEITAWYKTHPRIQGKKIGVGATNVRDYFSLGIPPKENAQRERHTTTQVVGIIAWCKIRLLLQVNRTGGGVQYVRDCILRAIRPHEESVPEARNTEAVETINWRRFKTRVR